jgi:light-regulated signal transduction histidine kinase (bacteriophytochrome)
VDEVSMVIEYASTNTLTYVGAPAKDIIGKPLGDLIGADNLTDLRKLSLDPLTPELLRPWFISISKPDGQTLNAECLPHRQGAHLILEFMAPEPKQYPVWEDELLRRGIISELIQLNELQDLAEASARHIRDITGFDRVMIYKFAEDKHGEVIAESTNRPDSFLGLHYPASDIPDPARRHFTLNVMRSIPDINSELIPITNARGAATDAESDNPLDLTYSKLRAVAPVHVEYLSNMGVGASLSISLVTNNELWGLVACHHYGGTRQISSSRLRFAQLLGGTTSALLQSLENTAQLKKSIQAEKTAFYIEQQARAGRGLQELVKEQSTALMDLIDAHGMVLVLGEERLPIGTLPDKPLNFTGFRTLLKEGVAATQNLSAVIEMDTAQMENAAGAALLDLSGDGKDYLVFLRRNYDQTIRWAGKPEKIEKTGKDGVKRLSPRGSFALWREERHGQSKPFDACDRDALRILRRAFFALNSLERERAARDAQISAEAEEIRLRHALLDAARASSLGELASAIAHELNQPLAAVANYVSACRQEFRNARTPIPKQAEELMDDAIAETVRAGELVRRVRDFISQGDLNADFIDLNQAIRQGIELALVARSLPRLKVNMLLDHGIPNVLADSVQIGQVMLNLARNSITAMEKSEDQTLTIEVARNGTNVRVCVSDTGPGIPPDVQKFIFDPFHTSTTKGMGIGLSLCRSIVEAHLGSIWVEPTETGAALVFEIPFREEHNA